MKKIILALMLALTTACAVNEPGDALRGKLWIQSAMSAVKVNAITSTGSGVVVGDRYVLTANHVVSALKGADINTLGKKMLTVELTSGTKVNYTIEATDEERDIALLKLAKPLGVKSYCAPSAPPAVSYVYAVGWSLGRELNVSEGFYIGASKRPDLSGKGSDRINATIYPGNSGGPVYWYNREHRRFEVIGLSDAIAVYNAVGPSVAPNLGYIVSLKAIRKFLADHSHSYLCS